jgi:hypothetical protein
LLAVGLSGSRPVNRGPTHSRAESWGFQPFLSKYNKIAFKNTEYKNSVVDKIETAIYLAKINPPLLQKTFTLTLRLLNNSCLYVKCGSILIVFCNFMGISFSTS